MLTQLSATAESDTTKAEISKCKIYSAAFNEIYRQLQQTPASSNQNPLTINGKFTSIAHLGAGGFGRVDLFRFNVDGKDVDYAIKTLRSSLPKHKPDSASYELIKERDLLRRLKHAHVIRAFELPQAPDLHVMESLAISLYDLTKSQPEKLLPPLIQINLAQHLASALAYLHSEEIAHLDLSWTNFVISKEGVGKLIDLGNAREFTNKEKQVARWGMLIFASSDFFSNQCSGVKKMTFRDAAAADVNSLGLLLFYIFTGKSFLDYIEKLDIDTACTEYRTQPDSPELPPFKPTTPLLFNVSPLCDKEPTRRPYAGCVYQDLCGVTLKKDC